MATVDPRNSDHAPFFRRFLPSRLFLCLSTLATMIVGGVVQTVIGIELPSGWQQVRGKFCLFSCETIDPLEPIPSLPRLPVGDFQFGQKLDAVLEALGKEREDTSLEPAKSEMLGVSGLLRTVIAPAHFPDVSEPLRATYGFWNDELRYIRYKHWCSAPSGGEACRAECDVVSKSGQTWFETKIGGVFAFPPPSPGTVNDRYPNQKLHTYKDPQGVTILEERKIWEDSMSADAKTDVYSAAVAQTKAVHFNDQLGNDFGSGRPGLITRFAFPITKIQEGTCNASLELAMRVP